jgi:catechol 2,3-dioxygenase-like lactoylglutathione lyase family enzyme
LQFNAKFEERQNTRGTPVKVKRIVANIETDNLEKAEAFYKGIFGLELAMDHGWLRTYGADSEMTVQVNVAAEGGSGTQVPDLSIEVDDLEVALARVKEADMAIEYGPKREPWGVRRFYVLDPYGKLINVLQHE